MKNEDMAMKLLIKEPMFNDEFIDIDNISKIMCQLKYKYPSLRKFKLSGRCQKYRNKKHKRSKNVIYWIEGDELEVIRKLHKRDGSTHIRWRDFVLPVLNDNNFIKHLSEKKGIKIIEYDLTNFLMKVGEEKMVQELLEMKTSNTYDVMCKLQEQ